LKLSKWEARYLSTSNIIPSDPSSPNYKIRALARCRWLMPVIPATQEAEIRRIEVQSQSRQKV
jgi:hypothetical protein